MANMRAYADMSELKILLARESRAGGEFGAAIRSVLRDSGLRLRGAKLDLSGIPLLDVDARHIVLSGALNQAEYAELKALGKEGLARLVGKGGIRLDEYELIDGDTLYVAAEGNDNVRLMIEYGIRMASPAFVEAHYKVLPRIGLVIASVGTIREMRSRDEEMQERLRGYEDPSAEAIWSNQGDTRYVAAIPEALSGHKRIVANLLLERGALNVSIF